MLLRALFAIALVSSILLAPAASLSRAAGGVLPPGALLTETRFDGTLEGWEVEGDGAFTPIATALRASPGDSGIVVRSPVFPEGTARVVLQFSLDTSGGGWNELQLRDAAGAKLLTLWAGSNKLCSAPGDCFRAPFTSGSHRVEFALVPGAADVTLDSRETRHLPLAADGAPARLAIEGMAPFTVWGFRAHAAGTVPDVSFASATTLRTAGCGTYYSPVSAAGMGAPVSVEPNLMVVAHTTSMGSRDPGYLSVGTLGGAGEVGFFACPTGSLGNRYAARVDYDAYSPKKVPDGQALLAGLTGATGPGTVVWAIVLAPLPRDLATPAGNGGIYFLDGAGRSQLLAPYGESSFWRALAANVDVEAGTLDLTLDGEPLASLTGVDLRGVLRLAMGDVSTAPSLSRAGGPGGSGAGYASYDAFVAAPLG